MESNNSFIPYISKKESEVESISKAKTFMDALKSRRSLRDFSDRPVPREIIEHILRSAVSAPSGANKQPWTFCVVTSVELKSQIRKAAEQEEYINYTSRMGEEWLEDLKPFGTDWHKPFLEIAPYLIIVFKKSYDIDSAKKVSKNYYVSESVGIACGFLIAAIHNAGLVTLTHTPSPMNFLQKILGRPENEKPFLLLPVGYPAEDAKVPDISKKPFDEVVQWF